MLLHIFHALAMLAESRGTGYLPVTVVFEWSSVNSHIWVSSVPTVHRQCQDHSLELKPLSSASIPMAAFNGRSSIPYI